MSIYKVELLNNHERILFRSVDLNTLEKVLLFIEFLQKLKSRGVLNSFGEEQLLTLQKLILHK